jgi:hypothetical protein
MRSSQGTEKPSPAPMKAVTNAESKPGNVFTLTTMHLPAYISHLAYAQAQLLQMKNLDPTSSSTISCHPGQVYAVQRASPASQSCKHNCKFNARVGTRRTRHTTACGNKKSPKLQALGLHWIGHLDGGWGERRLRMRCYLTCGGME